MLADISHRRGAGHWAAILGVAVVTAAFAPFQATLSTTTVALAYLLVVLFVAAVWGRTPPMVASVLAMLCFNFFFLPPIYTFTIADPQNWIALTAFLVTAITAGRLSERAKRRAAAAGAARAASAYNRSLIEASLDPLVTIDADGTIIDVNAAAEAVTGRPRDELIGTDFSGYFTGPERARAGYQEAWRAGFVRDHALELRHRDGHSTSVLYNASVYRDDSGLAIGVVAAVRPIRTSAGQPARASFDGDVVRGVSRFVSFAGVFSACVGALGLAGWMFRIPVFKSVIPGQVVIRPNAAVCLVLIGLSLWLMRKEDDHLAPGARKLSGQLLAAFVATLGLLSLTEHVLGWDLGIDQLLFQETAADAMGSLRPGLMAPITALDFVLLGLALLGLDWTIRWRARRYSPAQVLAGVAGIASIVGLLDFVLKSDISSTHIALQTAVTLCLLSLAVVCARTERGVPALFVSGSVGGTLVRRLLPAAIVVPILIGALSWKATSAGVSSAWGGGTLMIVAMIVLLANLTVLVGYLIDRADVERRRAEGTLRRREEELREAQRLARVGSWWWDPRANQVGWSEELCRIVGRDPKLPPPGYHEHARFYTAESVVRLDAAVQHALRTGTPYELDLDMVTADGALRSVTGRGEVERDADGHVVLVRGTMHDITERKQAEAALQRSADEIRDLYDHAPCGYHSLDKDGVFVRINDTELEWLGYAREEVIGKVKFPDLLGPKSRSTFEAEFPRLKTEGAVRDIEFDLVRKDGTILPVLVSATAITDPAGTYLTSRSMVYDMTERKRAEEALRESEANLNKAQEIAHLGSWHLDVARDRLSWSDEVFRIFGVPSGMALTYEAFLARVYPPDREAVEQAWAAALRGARYDIEHRIVVGGELKWVRERAQIESDTDGRAVRGIGTVQDISERKRAEEQLRRVNRAHRALSTCNEALVRATDESSLLRQICQIIVEQAGYRLCWVGYADADAARTVRPIAQAGFDDGYLTAANITWADTERGRGPTGTCIRTGEIQIAKNIATDPTLAPWRADALRRGYASSIAIPLVGEGHPFGALTIYSSEIEAFGDEEVRLLTELAGDLGYGIVNLRTQAERKRAEAEEVTREREVAIGFRIQQMLLLDEPPRDIPGLRVAALTIPSQRIAGDFYEFFTHQDESLDIIVADVMGKGIPAALLGAATKSRFTEALCHLMALSPTGALPEPREVVTLAHAGMGRQLIELESFVTLCYARVDLTRHRVDLVDCGHTGVIHVRSGTDYCEMIHGNNLPLGVREGEIFDQITVWFEAGDVFLFYSDGVTEASNAAGERFGTDRLMACVRMNGNLAPQALVDAIRVSVLAFAGADALSDDLTCVAIAVEERQRPLKRVEMEIRSDLRDLSRARNFVRTFCSTLPGAPLDDDSVAGLELAVDEAASNVMKHAYRGRPDQRIRLEAEAFSDRVSIRLHHLGESFDPSRVRPPSFDASRESGFGVYLISRSVDDVRYYRDERGGNCIALVKLRNP